MYIEETLCPFLCAKQQEGVLKPQAKGIWRLKWTTIVVAQHLRWSAAVPAKIILKNSSNSLLLSICPSLPGIPIHTVACCLLWPHLSIARKPSSSHKAQHSTYFWSSFLNPCNILANLLPVPPALAETWLCKGQAVALVCSAGTPGVSDPGARLVAAALDAGTRVIPIPGACAVITSLVPSGLRTDDFLFLGFLPSKPGMHCWMLLLICLNPQVSQLKPFMCSSMY